MTHSEWFGRHHFGITVLVLFSAPWGAGAVLLVGESLGVGADSLSESVAFGAFGAVTATLLQSVVLLSAFILRIPFCAWRIALLTVFLGTPLALVLAHLLDRILIGGERFAWEAFLPQLVGIGVGWLSSAAVGWVFSRYRFVVVRVDDERRSPCPRCGYDLYGAGDVCPECGWELPPAVRAVRETDSSGAVHESA